MQQSTPTPALRWNKNCERRPQCTPRSVPTIPMFQPDYSRGPNKLSHHCWNNSFNSFPTPQEATLDWWKPLYFHGPSSSMSLISSTHTEITSVPVISEAVQLNWKEKSQSISHWKTRNPKGSLGTKAPSRSELLMPSSKASCSESRCVAGCNAPHTWHTSPTYEIITPLSPSPSYLN